MTNTDNMEQIDYDLFDASICRNKDEIMDQCDGKSPSEPNGSIILIDRIFSYHVGRSFGDISLKIDSRGTTKNFPFEFYPCGGFLEYNDSFHVEEKSTFNLYRNAGYNIHTHFTKEMKVSFKAGIDVFGAQAGYDKTDTYDIDKSDQITLSLEIDFTKGNYFCYQYSMVMANKLDESSKSYIDTIMTYNKGDADIRKVGNDLYIFHAAHRKNLIIKTTDNLYKPVSYQTFVDFLCNNPEVWNTQNYLDSL